MDKLRKGDTIGIVCPSHVADPARHKRSKYVLESLGYRVKFGENVYKDTYGYLASEQERADDFNTMARDREVKIILFGGGEGAPNILPLIDYDAIKANPKLICSFSDGTSILNAIHAMTGLTVYYGQAPGMFNDLRHYDYTHFASHFIDGGDGRYTKDHEWLNLNAGKAEGTLVGGYLRNFTLMLGSPYFSYDKSKKYILFLEDHEKYNRVAAVGAYLSHIEQHDIVNNVAGLIFGHYSETINEELLGILSRFGQRHGIPVAYTDDFGHGTSHALFPIGQTAAFDADAGGLTLL